MKGKEELKKKEKERSNESGAMSEIIFIGFGQVEPGARLDHH